jgi:hypothetical protein
MIKFKTSTNTSFPSFRFLHTCPYHTLSRTAPLSQPSKVHLFTFAPCFILHDSEMEEAVVIEFVLEGYFLNLFK